MKIRHTLSGLAAVAALVVGVSVTPAASAASPTALSKADASATTRHWVQWMDNYIVDAVDHRCIGGHYLNNLDLVNCYNTASYITDWDVTADNGSFKFFNSNAQGCLDGSARFGVRLYTCSDASYNNGYQKWVEYTYSSDGTWVDWKNVATGQCLDKSSTYGLRLYTCSRASFDNGYQKWAYRG